MDDSRRSRTRIGRAVVRIYNLIALKTGQLNFSQETALIPLHAAASKPAQKAYLGTFLFAATSLILFVISSFAYGLFYYNYVPQNSVERVIYLQFGYILNRFLLADVY